jgi:nitrite reductase/ring-hydroxylating ferredoxin subunit
MEMVPCDDALPDVLATIVKHLDLFKQVEPLKPQAKDRILMVPAYIESEEGPDDSVTDHLGIDEASLQEEVAGATPACPTEREAGRQTGGGIGVMTANQTTKVRACTVAELAEGCGKLVTINGKALALFRLGERVVALDAECPHEGGPLQEGTIEEGCVVCPWHNYKFALGTGRCDTDESLCAKTYPASLVGEEVWVEVI